jgi:copper chaperone CopZ
MDCPNEENDIRKALAGIDGIRSLRFELAARTLTIEGEQLALESGLQAIRQLGFEVLPIEHEQKTEMPSGLGEISKALIALALAIGAEALDFFAPDTLLFKGLGMALAAAAIAFSGFSTYRKGLAALRRGQLNMNALMGVAVTGAFLIGQWPEAAMVMALYAIAELIEARSVDRARNAIKGLSPGPETAEIRQGDGSWQEMPADKVAIGTRPGQARRPHPTGWASNRRQQCGQSGAGHRREHSGRQGGGRSRFRRHHQRDWYAGIRGDGCRQQHDPGPHHPCRRGSPRHRAPTQRFVDRLPRFIRRPFLRLPWPWPLVAPGCSPGPGRRRSTRRWFCW